MYTTEALLDLHERTHRSLEKLLSHCRQLRPVELDRALAGFGYHSVRLQLHHEIGAEEYWIGVLQGRIDAADTESEYPTVESLERYRRRVFAATEDYMRATSTEHLNVARNMLTWRNKERLLIPARIILRTQMHIYHHQGQIVAMCRLLRKPTGSLDFPIT